MRSWTCPNCKAVPTWKRPVPLGDAESLQRLEERTDGMTTRAAGSSALVDADLPDEQPSEAR